MEKVKGFEEEKGDKETIIKMTKDYDKNYRKTNQRKRQKGKI